jgi:hypothetical protein
VKKYVVDLSKEEAEQLRALTHKGACGARKLRRAQILLAAEEGLTDERIAQVLGTGVRTVERVRKRFVEEGPRRPSPRGPGRAKRPSWTAVRRPTWWLWPAPILPRKPPASAGACGYWPRGWWSSRWSMRSPKRPSGGRSKRGPKKGTSNRG